MNFARKLCTSICICALVLTMMPASALAAVSSKSSKNLTPQEEASALWQGEGTEESPYLVTSYDQLTKLRDAVNAGEPFNDQYFELTQDIDFDSNVWDSVIGKKEYSESASTQAYFGGIFNGAGHSITANISVKSMVAVGLFGYVGASNTKAAIKNLVVKGSITSSASHSEGTAGIAGNAQYATIEKCENQTKVEGFNKVGGIVGYAMRSNLDSCANTGEIKATMSGSNGIAGGLIGEFASCTLKNSYSTGAVSGYYSGGLVGLWSFSYQDTSSSLIQNCFAASKLTNKYGAEAGNGQGALIAEFSKDASYPSLNTLKDCYADTSAAKTENLYGPSTSSRQSGATITGVKAYDTAYMQTSGFVSKLNKNVGATAADLVYASTDTYPNLYWQDDAGFPTITVQPNAADSYTVDEEAQLQMNAVLPQKGLNGSEGALTFAWYKAQDANSLNPANDECVAQAQSGSVSKNQFISNYTIPTNQVGTSVYYCVVTNSFDSKSYSIVSSAVEVNVVEAAAPLAPEITTQPKATSGEQEKGEAKLSVEAKVFDNGALSYQWFSCETAQGANPQKVDGAAKSTLAVNDDYAGTYYYYCEVINTLNKKKASVKTDIVEVTITPGQISSAVELQALAKRVNGDMTQYNSGDTLEGKSFVLTEDIDLANLDSQTWEPIGARSIYRKDISSSLEMISHPFKGNFDGQGHSITGLNAAAIKSGYQMAITTYGLFGFVQGSTIKNLVLEGEVNFDSSVVGSSLSSSWYIGGVVGLCDNTTALSKLSFSGTLKGGSNTGGIVGFSGSGTDKNTALIEFCAADVTISAAGNAGGIAGASPYTKINACYAWGSITSTNVYSSGYLGGISGRASLTTGDSCSISACYSTVSLPVVSSESAYCGGIAGNLATDYPAQSFYLDTSCSKGAGHTDSLMLVSMSEEKMFDASFVDTLNDAAAGDDLAFKASSIGEYPVLAWQKQVVTYPITLKLTTPGSEKATIVLTNAEGREYRYHGTAAQRTYYLPEGTYKAYAYAFGFEDLTKEITVNKDQDAAVIDFAMTEAKKNKITFNFDTASTDGQTPRIWISSARYGLLYQDYTDSNQFDLPQGDTYSYTCIVDGKESASGSVALTADGDDITENITFIQPQVWDGKSYTAPVQSKDGEYLITKASELAGFGTVISVNSLANAQMLCDIYLNKKSGEEEYVNEWTPLASTSQPYCGHFNANSHVIDGLYIDSTISYVGLFTAAGNGAQFKNLIVSGLIRTSGKYAGAICAFAKDASVTFENCGNECDMSANSYLGGLLGYSNPGTSHIVTVSQCYNKGNLTASTSEYEDLAAVGGIVGISLTGTSSNLVISSCYNTGVIQSGAHTVGGIFGGGACTISNCINTGKVMHGSNVFANWENYPYPNASGALIGMWSSNVSIVESNNSYLTSTSQRAYGYSSSVPLATAQSFEDASFFDTQIGAYTSFVIPSDKQFNDGYPRLSWEDESKVFVNPGLKGSQKNPFTISSAQELVDFSNAVNEGRTYAGSFVELTADIDMQGVAFKPIGYGKTRSQNDLGTYFAGNFNGKGHAIKNLNINLKNKDSFDNTGENVGLFGVLRYAQVENVEVSGDISGTIWVGGIAGYAYNSAVSNCYSHANVFASIITTSTGEEYGYYVAGIVGQSYSTLDGAGSVVSCAFDGTVSSSADSPRIAAITTLNTSKSTLAGNYYTKASYECGTDKDREGNGVYAVETLHSKAVAWNLNTACGSKDNSGIWGMTKDGKLAFACNEGVGSVYRVVSELTGVSVDFDIEYALAGETISFSNLKAKKGYTLTSGLIVEDSQGNAVGGFDGNAKQVSGSFIMPSSDLKVTCLTSFDKTTLFDIQSNVQSDDEVVRSASIDVATQSVCDKKQRVIIKDIDAQSRFVSIKIYEANNPNNVIESTMKGYGSEYSFTMPRFDVVVEVTLCDINKDPESYWPSTGSDNTKRHIYSGSEYSSNYAYMSSLVTLDGSAESGISKNNSIYQHETYIDMGEVEQNSSSKYSYAGTYSVREEDGSSYKQTYQGLVLYDYLVNCQGLSKDLSDDTPVIFSNARGQSITLTIAELKSKKYCSYEGEGDSVYITAYGLPVLLAYAEGNAPLGMDVAAKNAAGDPVRYEVSTPFMLVTGQKDVNDVNATKQLMGVDTIRVGSNVSSASHAYDPYSKWKDQTISFNVFAEGEDKAFKTVTLTVAEIEDYLANHQSARELYSVKASQFSGASVLQSNLSDIYEGVDIYSLLIDKGIISKNAVKNGSAEKTKISFYSSNDSSGKTVPLEYIAGGKTQTYEENYIDLGDDADSESGSSTYPLAGVRSFIAFAKNGYPLVETGMDAGFYDYNRYGPLIAVLPYNSLYGVYGDSNTSGNIAYDSYAQVSLSRIDLTVPASEKPAQPKPQAPKLVKGKTYTAGSGSSKALYKVTSTSAKTVTYYLSKVSKSAKKIIVPSTVKINGVSCKVTAVASGACKSFKKVSSLSIGSNVSKIGSSAFKNCKKLKTLTIKTTKLTKKGVKKSLKSSKITKIKLSGKSVKKKLKKYKSYFKKSNSGRSVRVK